MRYSDVYIAGLANWMPDRQPVSEAVAAGWYDAAEQEANCYESVPVAGAQDAPPQMAVRAAQLAMQRSGVQPGDVALLLHASLWHQGLDFWTAAPYIHQAVLGPNQSAPAIDIGQMSCGTLGGLELAASYLAASPARRAALVTAADRFQLPAFDRWRTDVSGIVYGDGAAAVVLSRDAGFARLAALTTVVDTTLEPMYRGDAPFAAAGTRGSAAVDNRARRDDFLRRAGRDYILTHTTQGLTSAVSAVLDDAGLTLADISGFVFPNVGRGVLCARYLEPLGIDLAATAWDFGRTTAHVGTADQLTGLEYLTGPGRVAPGGRVLLTGIGAGFTWSCAVIECVAAQS